MCRIQRFIPPIPHFGLEMMAEVKAEGEWVARMGEGESSIGYSLGLKSEGKNGWALKNQKNGEFVEMVVRLGYDLTIEDSGATSLFKKSLGPITLLEVEFRSSDHLSMPRKG